ncbi:MAG: ATP-binding cassette domain-containing protein [Alphaproteobacteria bacterium]
MCWLDVGGVLRTKALVASAMYARRRRPGITIRPWLFRPDPLGFSCREDTLAGLRHRRQPANFMRSGGSCQSICQEWFRFLERHYLLAYGAAMPMTVVLPRAWDPRCARCSEGRAGHPCSTFRPTVGPTIDRPSDRPPAKTRPAGGMPVLEIVAVGKRFGGVMALADISLSVHAGEILGLIGPNGSGKSTLLNAVSGLVVPDAGQIRIAGQNAIGRPPHRIAAIGVGRSFQTPAATGPLSALDPVAVAAAAGGARYELARYELARQAALALLTELGAPPPGDAQTLRHSAAMLRRRVEIARPWRGRHTSSCLTNPPPDWPIMTIGTCPPAPLRRMGTAIVIVEHNLPFLLGIADRIVCLDAGRIIAEGSPDAISRDRA